MSRHIQDHSMRVHDSQAIPGFPLRRPRTPTPTRHTIIHLVKAHDLHLAATHLTTIINTDPNTIPTVVHAIRKHLLPPPTRRPTNPNHPLTLLHHLVLTVPYFYRYIASSSFFRSFWRLQFASDPVVSFTVRLLVRSWARDLQSMARHKDPAASFWVLTYRRLARSYPFPEPPPEPFVRHVSASISTYAEYPPPPLLETSDVTASLRLLDQLVKAATRAAHADDPSLRHSSNSYRLHSRIRAPPSLSTVSSRGTLAHHQHDMAAYVSVPEDVESPRPSDGIMYGRRQPLSQKKSKKPTESRLNEKLLAVLRRHDDTFGHTDPYFIAPPTRNMTFELESYTHISRVTRSSTSTATSVAAMARENARRKLHESQSLSWSMSYHADRSSTDADAESFLEGLTYGYEHEEMAAVAVTPSTFAELGVGDQKAGREHDDDDGEFEDDERYDARGDTDTWGCIESLGDTVLLPEGFGLENFAAMQNSTSGDQSLSNDNDASGSGSVGCDT